MQHAGGGKAQQYFLRGFDLDHGTDLAFFVDGVPVNAVSHAHGQGFSDLHFIIPETIDTLESTKGPYCARVGDFATAGSVTFHMADHVDESIAQGRGRPRRAHARAVVVESPDLGDDWRMVVAAEVFNEDGPFIHPEDYDRFNGYAKVTRALDERSELSLDADGVRRVVEHVGRAPGARGVRRGGRHADARRLLRARTASAGGTRSTRARGARASA